MARREEGIRSYGPGKFHTLIDGFAYEVTLDGGADEEASYPDGGGWYGLIRLDDDTRDQIEKVAEAEGERLTDDELALLDEHAAVIFFERSDGIVEADWFRREKDADKQWAEILVDTEGDDEEEEEEEEGMHEGASELAPFHSWKEVLAYAQRGGTLFYKAPLDHSAMRLSPRTESGQEGVYEAHARTIRIWPYGSTGRGRNRTSDPFTADSGHLDRFLHAESRGY